MLAGAIDMVKGDSMSAIQASFVKVAGTLQDGTLRLLIDIEPRDAQAAFALFHMPGTPMAIAALKVGYAAVDEVVSKPPDSEPEPLIHNDKSGSTTGDHKGGALAKLAGQWCADPVFQKWLFVYSELEAAQKIKHFCEVDSRRMLDHNPKAADLFQGLFRTPYMKHLRGIELTEQAA